MFKSDPKRTDCKRERDVKHNFKYWREGTLGEEIEEEHLDWLEREVGQQDVMAHVE